MVTYVHTYVQRYAELSSGNRLLGTRRCSGPTLVVRSKSKLTQKQQTNPTPWKDAFYGTLIIIIINYHNWARVITISDPQSSQRDNFERFFESNFWHKVRIHFFSTTFCKS
jgi:hypothetical protein